MALLFVAAGHILRLDLARGLETVLGPGAWAVGLGEGLENGGRQWGLGSGLGNEARRWGLGSGIGCGAWQRGRATTFGNNILWCALSAEFA